MARNESPAVRQARIRAKALSRATGEPYSRILDELARRAGHGTWKALREANPIGLPAIRGTDQIDPDGWLARITFPSDVGDGTPYLPGWFVDNDMESDPDAAEVANGLLHSVPLSARWTDARTVEYRTVHRHHALGVLGCMPLRRLSREGVQMEAGPEGELAGVAIADLGRKRRQTRRPRESAGGVVRFHGDWIETPEWDFEPSLASTAWDWLSSITVEPSTIVGLATEARSELDGRPSAIITVRPGSDRITGLLHERHPYDMEEALSGWTGCEAVDWTVPVDMDVGLHVLVTADETRYLATGHDFQIHVEESVVQSRGGYVRPLVDNRMSLWWRRGRTMMHAVQPVLLGAKTMDIGHGAHRLDRDILAMMGDVRPLGELPIGDRPFMIRRDATRGVALMGDYPM